MRNQGKFYAAVLLIFGLGLWVVIEQGKHLETRRVVPQLNMEIAPVSAPAPSHVFSGLLDNTQHPLAVLVIQILIIMLVARLFGHLMTRIGQPSVVGEIIAGIALGPSLLGHLFPEFSAFLFPEESLRRLHVLSQIGLVLFMFIIGMELNIGVLKRKAQSAVIISHTSIVVMYFLGCLLAYFLYPLYCPQKIPFIAFALFMGIAMSITAFPVLARIVQERDLTHTSIGTVAITCAAADDITAWCLLALVIAIVGAGGIIGAASTALLFAPYVLFMWFVVRPILGRMAVKYDSHESIKKSVVAAIFGILLASSYISEVIGIHALFGAFLAGVIMPEQKEFKRILTEKIEDISLVMLLPMFFVFTGLRTQVGLLNETHLWGICLLIIGIASGKFVTSTIASKIVGHSWKDSLLIGALMNTRGLMELVVLNIGYDLGVLSTEIFTMMVLMALATTFMTGPAIHAIEYFFKSAASPVPMAARQGFGALLAFGSPQSGSRLLHLAHYLNFMNERDSSITVAHFSPSSEISIIEAEQNEREAFAPVTRTAERLGIALKKVFKVTDNVESEILDAARGRMYDLLLVGSSRELFKADPTGGKIGTLLHRAPVTTGVVIDRGFTKIDNVLAVLGEPGDVFLLAYAKRFLEKNDMNALMIWDTEGAFKPEDDPRKAAGIDPGRSSFIDGGPAQAVEDIDKKFDLVIVSLSFWNRLGKKQGAWLSRMPSVLILSPSCAA